MTKTLFCIRCARDSWGHKSRIKGFLEKTRTCRWWQPYKIRTCCDKANPCKLISKRICCITIIRCTVVCVSCAKLVHRNTLQSN